ncbi:hypothetical protein MHUMG1_09114 [Metarhizium humberi]|uniref:Uncharacterized protein n=1 Tax=Metarhizium humberi TaxID=2596975 RepID=A0A9P8M406_9HYPO|nr:hypothetical protein MHUMG1_09114 [Metarhizium humberi]
MADISESLVASLAETLDAAGAPCILWGQFLLNVHGIPSTIAHLTLASSSADLPPRRPGRGSGFFTTVEYPVVVLRLHALLEAYIRLYLRDRKRRDGAYARHSVKLLTPCIDVEELPGSREISDRIKRYYKTLANGDEIILGRSGM